MEGRAARVAFRRSQAVVIGVSLSLFALLIGGLLVFLAAAGDTLTPATASLAWLLSMVAPLVGAAASIVTGMTRPLQVSVAISTASLIVLFVVIGATTT